VQAHHLPAGGDLSGDGLGLGQRYPVHAIKAAAVAVGELGRQLRLAHAADAGGDNDEVARPDRFRKTCQVFVVVGQQRPRQRPQLVLAAGEEGVGRQDHPRAGRQRAGGGDGGVGVGRGVGPPALFRIRSGWKGVVCGPLYIRPLPAQEGDQIGAAAVVIRPLQQIIDQLGQPRPAKQGGFDAQAVAEFLDLIRLEVLNHPVPDDQIVLLM
jgi:hypothetical protein